MQLINLKLSRIFARSLIGDPKLGEIEDISNRVIQKHLTRRLKKSNILMKIMSEKDENLINYV